MVCGGGTHTSEARGAQRAPARTNRPGDRDRDRDESPWRVDRLWTRAGQTNGIGMAIGKVLGKAGAKICVNDLTQDKLDACVEEYKKEGIDVFTLVFNVTDEAEVNKGISTIEKEVGPIDILVNNAGIIKRIPILDMSIKDYQQVIDVDLVAPLILAKRVAPSMK